MHTYNKLEGCIVLNEHNTVFARSGPLYATCVSLGPTVATESSTQTASRSLQPFLQSSLGDRPTDHATRSVTIGGAHSGEAKFCYCLRLQQVIIGAVDSTDPINFSNQHLYWAARLDGLQCIWRHTAVYARKERFPSAYSTGDTTAYLRTSCLVPAFDDTKCHVPASEWYQRYLSCYLLSISNSVCFFPCR